MPALHSTNLASVNYNETTRDMTITFRSGAIYTYSDVDQETYDRLLSAPSAGAYFASQIKDKFEFVRV